MRCTANDLVDVIVYLQATLVVQVEHSVGWVCVCVTLHYIALRSFKAA